MLMLVLWSGQLPAQLSTEPNVRNREPGGNEKIVSQVESIQEPIIPEQMINLIEYAKAAPDANGTYDFRTDIQSAIDQLNSTGGGTLFFPHTAGLTDWRKHPEVYRIKGSIQLKSNVQLLLDPATILQFEFDPTSYLPDGQGVISSYEGSGIISWSALIRGYNITNIAIRARKGGNGAPPELRGDGVRWKQWSWAGQQQCTAAGTPQFYERLREANHADVPLRDRIFINPETDFFRPVMLEFFLCKTVLVDGIKITDPPFWCVHPVFSENLIFRNLLFNAYGANSDGIDPDSSRNILIENVVFNNQDDNVALKAGRDRDGRDGINIEGTPLEPLSSAYIRNGRLGGPTENVVVRNCVFKGHYALCIGSEMSGSVRNVFAIDNRSVQNVKMGFFIKSSRKRGGTVENILIRDLHLNDVEKDVICLIPNYDNDAQSPYPPIFKNIQIENVTAKTAQNGIRIVGWSDAPIENVSITDLTIDRLDGTAVEIHQARQIALQHVTIDGTSYDGIRSPVDNETPPPAQN